MKSGSVVADNPEYLLLNWFSESSESSESSAQFEECSRLTAKVMNREQAGWNIPPCHVSFQQLPIDRNKVSRADTTCQTRRRTAANCGRKFIPP